MIYDKFHKIGVIYLETKLNDAKKSLDVFYQDRKDQDEDTRNKTNAYLGWVNKKTTYIKNEKSYVVKNEKNKFNKIVPIITRGKAFWIHFGFNIGQEFGGHHPGIVLKTGGQTAIVVPLSTQEPTPYQKTLVNYVEVESIPSFPILGYSRWINLLNTMPISFQRFDDDGKVGKVPGPIMSTISIAMNQLWRP